jgi:hypothetical protein
MQRFLITFQGLELEALFVAGDANQDGVLTFSEFREILRTADSTVSHQIALRMFRETLCFMPDGGDNISPFAFATVAHAHGIKAPPSVVFNLLKKTWLQVSSIVHNPNSLLHNVPAFGVIYTAPTTDVWHKIIHKRSKLERKTQRLLVVVKTLENQTPMHPSYSRVTITNIQHKVYFAYLLVNC